MNNIKIIYCIGIPLIAVAFPIFNDFHIKLSMLMLIVGFIYVIYQIFIKYFINYKILKKVYIILFLIVITCNILRIIQVIKDETLFFPQKNSAYYGTFISREIKDKINNVCNFIVESEKKGINTIILSTEANLYMIPLNKNNKYGMDLPNKGNFGSTGEKGIIEKIQHFKQTYILIPTNDEALYQESEMIREYIENNWDKIGIVSDFYIYYKK